VGHCMLTMADCRRRIQFEFFLGTLRARRESLRKIDLLMKQLEQFRTALRTEAGLIEQYEEKQKAKLRKSNKARHNEVSPEKNSQASAIALGWLFAPAASAPMAQCGENFLV
jgi:vacuolar-type H+-ATPase subunit I/STV1